MRYERSVKWATAAILTAVVSAAAFSIATHTGRSEALKHVRTIKIDNFHCADPVIGEDVRNAVILEMLTAGLQVVGRGIVFDIEIDGTVTLESSAAGVATTDSKKVLVRNATAILYRDKKNVATIAIEGEAPRTAERTGVELARRILKLLQLPPP